MSPSYYAVIPSDVRYDERLRSSAKLLYGELTALSNKEGYCWASNQHFADLYKVDKKTISAWISSLVKLGYIKVVVDRKGGNKRKITIIKTHQPINQKVDTYTQKDVDNNKYNTTINSIFVHWNKVMEGTTVPKLKAMTSSRKNALMRRIKEGRLEDWWIRYINDIRSSDFLMGKVNGWSCNFDWILKPSNISKVTEGNYTNNAVKNGYSVDEFKLDSTGRSYIGYCSKCNVSDFYDKYSITNSDSRCCNAQLKPKRN